MRDNQIREKEAKKYMRTYLLTDDAFDGASPERLVDGRQWNQSGAGTPTSRDDIIVNGLLRGGPKGRRVVDDEHSFVGEGEVRVRVVRMWQFRTKRHSSSKAVSMMKASDVL